MPLPLTADPAPLEMDDDGVVRVGKTRVTLDTVVAAFLDGATAEEIAQQYPFLLLADIYHVIGHYLRHRPEVDTYLRQRQQPPTRCAGRMSRGTTPPACATVCSPAVSAIWDKPRCVSPPMRTSITTSCGGLLRRKTGLGGRSSSGRGPFGCR